MPFDKDRRYERQGPPPQIKTDIFNLKKEVGELKTELYNMKQFFASEKPGYVMDKITIVFKDGSTEPFTNAMMKKYTIEALDRNGGKTLIEKSSIRYIKVLS